MNDPLLRIISRRDLKKSSSTTAKWAQVENAKAFTTTVKPLLTATAQPGKEFLVTRNFLIPKVKYMYFFTYYSRFKFTTIIRTIYAIIYYFFVEKKSKTITTDTCQGKVESFHD